MKEEGGYVDYLVKVQGIKEWVKSVKFSEYYFQVQLFYNFFFEIEKFYVLVVFGFEFDYCDEVIVYDCMIKRFVDIDFFFVQFVVDMVGGMKFYKVG